MILFIMFINLHVWALLKMCDPSKYKTFVQWQRHWADVVQMLYKFFVFAGI